MVSFRHYQDISHTHEHYCPACKCGLVLQESSQNMDVEELDCVTGQCPVYKCYCNGVLSDYSVTIDELFKCVDDIFTITGGNPVNIITSFESFSSFGGEVRSHIDSVYDELSVEDEVSVEQRFECFARLERVLSRRDYSTEKQVCNTGERVLDFNGVYIPYSEVLIYTVVTDEFDDQRLIHYPTSTAPYLDESDVEAFKVNIESRFLDFFD